MSENQCLNLKLVAVNQGFPTWWPSIHHVFKVSVKDGAQLGLIVKNLIYTSSHQSLSKKELYKTINMGFSKSLNYNYCLSFNQKFVDLKEM